MEGKRKNRGQIVFPKPKWVTRMYMGEYNHTIDTKGRLIVPMKFREQLGDKFIITRGFEGCLMIYDNDEWEKVQEKIATQSILSKEARALHRYLIGGATIAEIDKQGRTLVPPILRNAAGITKDVVLLGVGNKIEVWSKEKWDIQNDCMNIEDIAEQLNQAGITL